ncbi:MAG: hypothetical protein B6I36_11295 [Desulfobacteraceae bacterium 4572_35.1]|nr:MAG: hypothetical protein B6I36_11295 [Desulfobacteraceae bacterium 4572_35.1]
MIHVEGLSFSYGDEAILQQTNFHVYPGELLTILGPNGAGKSTLLRLLRGRLRPDGGCVKWRDGIAHQLSRAHMATLVAVLPQLSAQPFAFSVREMVSMGCFAANSSIWGISDEQKAVVERTLKQTDIAHLANRAVCDLSGGELQRVLLARALAQQTPVLLLDEVTSQLDLGHTRSIAKLLYCLCRAERKTIIQVSHDMELAAEISQRILLLDSRGETLALGTPSQVLTAANIAAAFGVQVKVEIDNNYNALRVNPAPIR